MVIFYFCYFCIYLASFGKNFFNISWIHGFFSNQCYSPFLLLILRLKWSLIWPLQANSWLFKFLFGNQFKKFSKIAEISIKDTGCILSPEWSVSVMPSVSFVFCTWRGGCACHSPPALQHMLPGNSSLLVQDQSVVVRFLSPLSPRV